MNFTEAVVEAMEKLGLKKSDLARATGYSYQYIRDLLNGERRWNEDSINKVCHALGIQVNFEFEREEQIK
ncbi:helix-turn-helix transcriptional regulator [Halalkalibacterium halodurans]|uniref:helix-turn-helix domain-containing protein n=1 Tax=Halalkalibacterium halodurans TaxID=86665 RepID=UPI002E20A3B8|nr:helix-turn-helix transcriptional regulator [Halalkalibacterium halodurans]